jgi:hypothetical protein
MQRLALVIDGVNKTAAPGRILRPGIAPREFHIAASSHEEKQLRCRMWNITRKSVSPLA